MHALMILPAAALAAAGITAGPALASDAMIDALRSGRPDTTLAAKLQTYGRFVGSWTLEAEYHPPEGPPIRAAGEWHFDWVLDGRAVQDVFILPAWSARVGKARESWWFYGSTVRWFDPAMDAWHITYFEPSRPFEIRQIGRAVGPDIVQIGEEADGVIRRWRFVDIERDTFRWIGEASRDKGATWTLELEMRARRDR